MMTYARAFYYNLPDDNNQIVINSRGWNNTTGTGPSAIYRIPLTQIFDDVWFVGNHYVGQYMIKTADGIVQADAANTAGEVTTFNHPALQALGHAGHPHGQQVVLGVGGERGHGLDQCLELGILRHRWSPCLSIVCEMHSTVDP